MCIYRLLDVNKNIAYTVHIQLLTVFINNNVICIVIKKTINIKIFIETFKRFLKRLTVVYDYVLSLQGEQN